MNFEYFYIYEKKIRILTLLIKIVNTHNLLILNV